MNDMVKERNYGVDLLRLVLMFMVCMLHTLGQGGILKACEVGTLQYKTYWLFEILSYCAVDGFAIISGYMAIDKPRKYEKLVDMWFQAFFYSFIVTFILTIIGINENWGKIDVIKCALPITFGKFWYFTAYFALFFAVPILNKFIFGINEIVAKKALIILVVLFSIVGGISDPFETQWGYSAIWLILLYLIGALSKRIKLFETKKSLTLLIIWAVCILCTWVIHIFAGIKRLTNYVSPTILLSGIIMVVLFSRINVKGSVISKISPLTFGVYLFQLNQVIWNVIIKDAFAFVVSKHIIVGVMHVFAFASLIFVAGLIVELIRNEIAKLIRIQLLSKKIVEIIDKWIVKLFVLL
jgi:hypothetical protein